MNRRLTIVALLALTALVVLWLSNTDRGVPETRAVGPPGAEDVPPPDEPGLPAPAEVEPSVGGEIAVEPDSAPSSIEEVAGRIPVGSWLEGRVVLPEGTPADEQIEVVARNSRWDMGPWAEDLGRANADENGEFRLGLAQEVADEEAGSVYLVLFARYVFLEEPLEVADPELPVVVEPRLGGAIRFRLVPPADSRFDPASILGREITMHWSEPSRGGFRSGPLPTRMLSVGEGLVAFAGGLAPENAYYLRSELAPFASIRSEQQRVLPGEMSDVEVALVDGIVLGGQVVDEEGRPADRARLHAGFISGVTEANGRFRLEGIAPDLASLEVSRDGLFPATIELGALGGGPDHLDLEIVLTLGHTIAGVVRLPDGRGVAGATIYHTWRSDDGVSSRTTSHTKSDETGRFVVTGLEDRSYGIKATARLADAALAPENDVALASEPRGDGVVWIVELETVPAGTADHDLVLVGPSGLEGTVVDSQGSPLTSYRLEAAQDRGTERGFSSGTLPFAEHRKEIETEDGRFQWKELPAGKWIVVAIADGYVSTNLARVELPGDVEPIRIVLRRSASIEGIVLDPAGQPVGDAWVQAVLITTESRSTDGRFRERTDEEGRFRIEGLSDCRAELLATAEGYAPNVPEAVDVRSGEAVSDIVLPLTEGGFLSVGAFEEDGTPAAYAQVTVDDRLTGDRTHCETDADGRAKAGPLRAGDYGVYVSKSEWDRYLRGSATVRDGETVEIRLGGPKEIGLVVTGSVTSGGEPVEEAFVVVWCPGIPEGSTSAQTDDHGQFTLELEQGGPALFQVTGPGHGGGRFHDVQLPVAGEHDVAFELPASGLRGRIAIEGERRLLGDIAIIVERLREGGVAWAGGDVVEVQPDRGSGEWSCLHLDPGRYRVLATYHPSFGPSSDGPYPACAQRTDVVLPAGEIVEGVDLELAASGTIEVVTRDEGNQPIPEAVVFVRDEGGRLLHPGGHRIGIGGRCTVHGLAPGLVHLEAIGEGLATPAPVAVEVASGEAATVELCLQAATMVQLQLAGLTNDASEVVIGLRDSAGREHAQERGSSLGWMHAARRMQRRFGPLPPGTWHAVARLPSGQEAESVFELGGEAERTVVLSFD